MKTFPIRIVLAPLGIGTVGAFLLLFCTDILSATPVSDLGSPSQEKRDAAANILRATYTPPSRTNWDSLVNGFRVGTPKTNVLEHLRSLKLRSGGGVGSGNAETVTYPLDDLWLLECSFTNTASGSGLARVGLVERLRNIWVDPPTNFTGVWTTYYANGQRSHEIHYKDGSQDGSCVLFRSDGSKAVVSTLVNGVAEGEETGFYPSGRLNHRGSYKAGSQVGTWIWYKEDGSVESKKDFPKP